jgi:hypothetical protein
MFLSNYWGYWWQRSDIWSQASYMYPISWEVFLDPSDSYFLFADFVDFYTHWTYILYKTGSRNLTDPKMRPTIWHTYMKLVTKYQIPVVNSCLEKCDEKCAYTNELFFIHIEHICTFFVTCFSATTGGIDDRDLIFGHKLHICTPYRGVGLLQDRLL